MGPAPLCTCAEEIISLGMQVRSLEAEGRFSGTWADYHEHMTRKVEELEREKKILTAQRNEYRDAVSSLEVHGTTGIVEEWVCVPATEWWQVFDKLNQP